jgi:hypothetical protein
VEYGHHYFEVDVRVPSAAAATEIEMQLLQRLGAALQQQPERVHHGFRRQRQQPQQQLQPQQQQQHWQEPGHQQGAAGVQLSADPQASWGGAVAQGQYSAGAPADQQGSQQQQSHTQPAAAGHGHGQHSSDPPSEGAFSATGGGSMGSTVVTQR